MKRVVIVALLVIIFAFLVTMSLIINKKADMLKMYSNKSVSQRSGEEEPMSVALYKEYHLPIDGVKGATTSQKFDINPLKFTEHVYEDEKTYAVYLQIDGLKDEEIERRINEELKAEIIDYGHYAYEILKNPIKDKYFLFDKYQGKKYANYEQESSWNSYVSEKILYNGNNVLSIALMNGAHSVIANHGLNQIGEHRFLNYNLATGKKIRVEELFTKDYNLIENYMNQLYLELAEGEIKWEDNVHYNEITGKEEIWRI
jgi:hypothetical protein